MTDAWREELSLLSRVLIAWHSYKPRVNEKRGTTGQPDLIRLAFHPLFSNDYLTKETAKFAQRIDEDWSTANDSMPLAGFMSVAPVSIGSPTLFPLVATVVRRRGSELEVTLRVVTFYLDTIMECVDAHGWRFDMRDADPGRLEDGTAIDVGEGHHHYPHVQRVTSWKPSESNLLPPSRQNFPIGDNMSGPVMNASRPAFPLPVKSPAGIVVAAMTSLYGAKITSGIVAGVTRQSAAFRREVREILQYP